MSHSENTRVHDGALVAGSATLGDFVVVYPGAEVGENCRVLGFTQLWSGVRLTTAPNSAPA